MRKTCGSTNNSGQTVLNALTQGKATLNCNTTAGLEERPSANLSARSAKPF